MAKKLRLDLSQFKASGIYTLEFDQSENIILTPQTVRLVVGFSRKGPFNAPVFCSDVKTAKTVYGEIDRTLERKGSFFHRTLETCLELGPCFALNLLKLNNDATDGDKTLYRSFSVDTAEKNGTSAEKLVSSFFNKERFWFPDTEFFLATVNGLGTGPEDWDGDKAKLLHFTNIGQTPMSIIIRKSNVRGYDVTAKEWYGTGNVPEYINENDFMSDFFIDVIAIQGDWTDAVRLSDDPVFSAYFNKNGLIASTLTDFLSLPEVQLVGSFTGSILPDFQDQEGVNQFIETIINNSVGVTGLFGAVNTRAIDDIVINNSKIDLVGHNLIDGLQNGVTEIDFLSYKAPLVEDNLFTEACETITNGSSTLDIGTNFGLPTTDVISVIGDQITVSGSSALANQILALTEDKAYFVDAAGSPALLYKLKITGIKEVAGDIVITVDSAAAALWVSSGEYTIGIPDCVSRVDGDTSPAYKEIYAYSESPLFQGWVNGGVQDGDVIYKDGSGTLQYLRFLKIVDADGFTYVTVRAYVDENFLSQEDIINFNASYRLNVDTFELVTGSPDPVINFVSLFGTYNEFIDVIPETGLLSNEVIVGVADASNLLVGDLLEELVEVDADSRLTRILQIATYNTSGDVKVTTNRPIKVFAGNKVQKFTKIVDFIQDYTLTSLSGFSLRDAHLPNNSDSRIEEIYGVLYDTNLAETLASLDIITFRYVIDTFNGGISTTGQVAKRYLTQLAKDRQKCLAFINAPSMKQFTDSTDPRFTDAATDVDPLPLLNTKYIADGGNLTLNPSSTFKLVDELGGSKFAGYFSPNLILRENGKNISFPPAAHVSNLYIKKFIDGTPFAIVAGSKRGLLQGGNLQGVEYDLSLGDRENLEPFGLNPIIKKRGQGILIYGNQTAFQRVNSAFNNLHVRDILITMESDVEAILENYLFEFNDDSTRLEIKSIVDNYLEGVQAAGGVFNFLTIMDRSNNKDEVIDQNTAIIDIIVEPPRGINKFINRITVTKTGGIASGGFTVA